MTQTPFVERLMQAAQPGGSFIDAIRAATPRDSHVLEIGPGTQPTFRRRDYPNLKVSDYCGTEELREGLARLRGLASLPPDLFDDIDYVCADGKLADKVPAGQKFDLIFSSHNIEHQPDLLTHLVNVERLLSPDGVATFLIPHHQHTFDVFRRLTSTSDVLLGHYGPPGLMTAQAIFDAESHAAQLPPGVIGGAGSYTCDAPLSIGNLQKAFARLQADLRGEPHEFEDYHHHIFSPTSLRLILVELYLLKLCSLLPCTVSGAVGNTFLIAVAPTPRPGDANECALFEAGLQAHRLDLYKEMAFRS